MKIQATTVVTMNISEVHAVVAAHLLTLGYKVVGFENGEYEVEKVEVVVNMFKVDVAVEDDEEVFKAQEVFKAVDLFKVPDVITMSHSKELMIPESVKLDKLENDGRVLTIGLKVTEEGGIITEEEFDDAYTLACDAQDTWITRGTAKLYDTLSALGVPGDVIMMMYSGCTEDQLREECFKIWAKVKTKLAEEEAELHAAKASYREQYDRAQEYARKVQEDADARQSDRDERVRNYHNSEALNAKAEVKRQKELLRKAREASKKKSEEIERLKAMVRDLKAKK